LFGQQRVSGLERRRNRGSVAAGTDHNGVDQVRLFQLSLQPVQIDKHIACSRRFTVKTEIIKSRRRRSCHGDAQPCHLFVDVCVRENGTQVRGLLSGAGDDDRVVGRQVQVFGQR